MIELGRGSVIGQVADGQDDFMVCPVASRLGLAALDLVGALERVEGSGHGGGADRNGRRVGARILRGVVVADPEAPTRGARPAHAGWGTMNSTP